MPLNVAIRLLASTLITKFIRQPTGCLSKNDYLVVGAMKCRKERPFFLYKYCIKLNIPFNIHLKGNLIPNTISFKTWHFHCDTEIEPL